MQANALKTPHLFLLIMFLTSTGLQINALRRQALQGSRWRRDGRRWSALAMLSLLASTPLLAAELFSHDEAQQAEVACIQLGNLYAHYLDTGQYELVPTLFAPQGTFHGQAGKYTGRESVALVFNRIDKNQRSIHVVTNPIVEIQSRNLIIVTSNFTTYKTDTATGVSPLQNQPVRVGIYTDECVRSDTGWLFQSRKMDIIFGQVE